MFYVYACITTHGHRVEGYLRRDPLPGGAILTPFRGDASTFDSQEEAQAAIAALRLDAGVIRDE